MAQHMRNCAMLPLGERPLRDRIPLRAALYAAVLGLSFFAAGAARAQLFSIKDGYAEDGRYQVQTELIPYLWLPAVSGTIHTASPRLGDVHFDSGFPTPADLAHSLHAAFMGTGLVRYGPWSAEFDIQYVDGSQSATVATGRFGRRDLRAKASLMLTRVAPGFGYKVYSGDVFGVPIMVDARAGFAYINSSETVTGEGPLNVSGGNNGSFVQPWLGGRVTFVPSPRWRVEVGALAQGLGVDDNSWGWAASVVGAYALTKLVDLSFGFRAIDSSRGQGSGSLKNSDDRSFSALAYGPVVGIGFRF
jgi:hypothetical protein